MKTELTLVREISIHPSKYYLITLIVYLTTRVLVFNGYSVTSLEASGDQVLALNFW